MNWRSFASTCRAVVCEGGLVVEIPVLIRCIGAIRGSLPAGGNDLRFFIFPRNLAPDFGQYTFEQAR